jgi:hypothetical protein
LNLEKDAEEIMEDLELKRKSDTQADQVGRKSKRFRMERLEGWGIGTTPVEELEDGGDGHLEDWKESTMYLPLEEIQKRRQTSIQDWTGKRARIEDDNTEDDNIREERKVVKVIQKTKKKRQTGKLTKKSETKSHRVEV